MSDTLRQHAEQQNAEGLHELQKQDNNPRPENWQLSPAAVVTYFVGGVLRAHDLIAGLLGAVVKDPVQDAIVWREYLETAVKPREDWKDLYRAARNMG